MSRKPDYKLCEAAVESMIDRHLARIQQDQPLSNGYAYTTGYLQSLVVSMLQHLPAGTRDTFLTQIIESK